MATSLSARGNGDRFALGDPFDLALQNSQLRRIDQIVRKIYRGERRPNFLEARAWIVSREASRA